MKQMNRSMFTIASALLICFANGCSDSADKTTATSKEAIETVASKPDNQNLKAEIQELENQWAKADNAGDATVIAAMYSDDAISMSNNEPMSVGNAAVKKRMEDGFAKRKDKSTVSYEVMDVYGCDNYATETGKTTRKDSTGNVMRTGKYMAVWEKRDGKWLCIRDISNDDVKRKD